MREVTAPRARRGDLDHAPRVGGRGPRRRVAAVVGLVLLAGAGTWIGVSSGSGPGSTSADRAGHPCSGPLGPAELCPLTGLSPPQSVLAPAADSYFSASSPFNQALPATTQAVAGTEWAARALASQPTADIYKYGVPIFSDVTDQTPRYHVTCTKRWGECPLSAQPVPVPPDAEPSSGSDAAMVIVDREAGLSYEFWQTRRSGNAWVASWGAVVSLSGLGNGGDFGPGGTGSGISALAGVVSVAEIEQGEIPHALSFSSSLTCDTFVPPAVKSDGTKHPPGCLPEGTRIRIPPSISLESIPGITPFELTVGRALQTYGAILRDSGGATLALSFQEPPAGALNPYAPYGASHDYFDMPHLPWGSVDVVNG